MLMNRRGFVLDVDGHPRRMPRPVGPAGGSGSGGPDSFEPGGADSGLGEADRADESSREPGPRGTR